MSKYNYIYIVFLFCLVTAYLFKYINKEKFNNFNIPKKTFLGSFFNIDKQCNSDCKFYLPWKCYWEKHLNKIPQLSYNNFNKTSFYNYLKNTPLRYDGIF